MKLTVQRRLEALESRARQNSLDAFPPGYAKQRLIEKLAQMHSRLPPEQLLYYQSPAGREALYAQFRAQLQSMSGSRQEGTPPSAGEILLRRILA